MVIALKGLLRQGLYRSEKAFLLHSLVIVRFLFYSELLSVLFLKVNDDDELWDSTAYYLAQLCASISLAISPHFIVLGGGIMQRECLFPNIRKHLLLSLNHYLCSPLLTGKALIFLFVIYLS